VGLLLLENDSAGEIILSIFILLIAILNIVIGFKSRGAPPAEN